MKKILFSLILLVLLSAIALATVSSQTAEQYNSSTNEVTFDVSQGWNMLPIGEGIGSTSYPYDADYCQEITSMFVWDTVSKQYLGGLVSNSGPSSADTQRASDAITSAKDSGYAFGSMGAAWAYVTKPCKLTMSFSGNALTGRSGRKILEGWNFITIMPWMLNKKFSEVAPDCTITKANSWEDSFQRWSVDNSRDAATALMSKTTGMPLRAPEIGTTLVIYAESDCELTNLPAG